MQGCRVGEMRSLKVNKVQRISNLRKNQFLCAIILKLLASVQVDIPDSTSSHLLRLELVDIQEDTKLPTIILIATTLKHLWLKRASPSRVQAYQVRAELEQTINMLRTSTLSTVENSLNTMRMYSP